MKTMSFLCLIKKVRYWQVFNRFIFNRFSYFFQLQISCSFPNFQPFLIFENCYFNEYLFIYHECNSMLKFLLSYICVQSKFSLYLQPATTVSGGIELRRNWAEWILIGRRPASSPLIGRPEHHTNIQANKEMDTVIQTQNLVAQLDKVINTQKKRYQICINYVWTIYFVSFRMR